MTQAVHLKDPHTKVYPIKKTGYYCVLTEAFTGDEYQAVAVFRNAYGELPATQVPKLPFYGGMTILYALVSAYAFFHNRHLRMQIHEASNANSLIGSGRSSTSNTGMTSVR